jgi:hypothetical protein
MVRGRPPYLSSASSAKTVASFDHLGATTSGPHWAEQPPRTSIVMVSASIANRLKSNGSLSGAMPSRPHASIGVGARALPSAAVAPSAPPTLPSCDDAPPLDTGLPPAPVLPPHAEPTRTPSAPKKPQYFMRSLDSCGSPCESATLRHRDSMRRPSMMDPGWTRASAALRRSWRLR